MGNLTVRNLDDGVIARLKAQARENGRSLEGETRHVLKRAESGHRQAAEFFMRADELAAKTVATRQTDSMVLVREDRVR
ncbi:FitA-like ribbon-helix-helix domain-containing protein [Candidatus Palauibacter sp.]|uniref:FitA-like ribbon-helix-helix domain-containing protein n=1 Tax=Candidatus Palauibacter sp. TaxID=3101350 RepID=UPI003B52B4A4